MTPQYARISINIPQLTGLFDYHIPAEFQVLVQAGSLVNVSFGKQSVQGIVISTLDEPDIAVTKDIEAVLESEPALTSHQLKLAQWLAHENLSTLSQCLDLMLPAGLSQHADILVRLTTNESTTNLTSIQVRILNALRKRGDLRGRQLDAAIPKVNWRESLPGLVKQNLVYTQPILPPPSVRPKFLRTAQFSAMQGWEEDGDLNLGRFSSTAAQRRRSILAFLQEQAIPVNVPWVYAETGAVSADLTYLAEKGLILLGETEIWRDPLDKLEPVLTQAPVLTKDQSNAWLQIQYQLENPSKAKPNLLVGVTGSGKTELYLRATGEVLNAGKGVIILVPEISLTPQTVKRFFARFQGKVGLIHSRLSPGEKYDTWRRIRSGLLPIVIGPRSALFAPLPDPGLIVIDECHDTSYHQEDYQPHYHTVDTALALSRLTGANLILGSATPGVELLHQFAEKKWNILHLQNRILAHTKPLQETPNELAVTQPEYSTLPEMQVVDMRKELVAGNRSALSHLLHDEIKAVLAREEQTILFLNRRGSASYVFCRECGFVIRCPRCDTQLTYHADETSLICHTCNYTRNMPKKCPECNSVNIRQFGMGTESLEKLVVEQFPGARVLRWDADTTRFKGAHDLILDHFTQHRADILIGTQMLAKGLDLPLVTLVGVVLADISLNMPDFRAAERTFQLLTQVAGRAGRSGRGGKVVIQTFQPDNVAIKTAAAYDTGGFFNAEMAFREKAGYPPFSRLLKIEFRHADALKTQEAALAAGEQINSWIRSQNIRGVSLIGPVPCFYQRRSGVYRWQILVKGPDPRIVLRDHPLAAWVPPGMVVDITIDPVNLL